MRQCIDCNECQLFAFPMTYRGTDLTGFYVTGRHILPQTRQVFALFFNVLFYQCTEFND